MAVLAALIGGPPRGSVIAPAAPCSGVSRLKGRRMHGKTQWLVPLLLIAVLLAAVAASVWPWSGIPPTGI